ncbi:TVP38/TMEM64 family protein [Halobellus sp. Atlit-31R]|nr:TVP38/TMEM64 family protein [Halobellus sp. Atlit-31R]
MSPSLDTRTKVAGLAVAGLALLVVAGGVAVTTLPLTDPAWIAARVRQFGPAAPLVFVLLQAVQVVLAPIPGQLLGGVAGAIFGPVLGATYSLVGVALGSAIVFGGTRRFGRTAVERVVDPATLSRWDEAIAGNGIRLLFGCFLLPTFPDDLLCFVAGLSDIRFRTFLALVVFGRGPTFLVAAYAGGQAGDGRLWLALAGIGLLVVLWGVVTVFRESILARIEG